MYAGYHSLSCFTYAVLNNEGLLCHIVSFIPVPRDLTEQLLLVSQRHVARYRKAVSLR